MGETVTGHVNERTGRRSRLLTPRKVTHAHNLICKNGRSICRERSKKNDQIYLTSTAVRALGKANIGEGALSERQESYRSTPNTVTRTFAGLIVLPRGRIGIVHPWR